MDETVPLKWMFWPLTASELEWLRTQAPHEMVRRMATREIAIRLCLPKLPLVAAIELVGR